VLRETQTLRAFCSKAEPTIFFPPQTTFLGAQDGQNLISWRWSLRSFTDSVWWGSMHAISSYGGNRPTNTHTHNSTQTHATRPLQTHKWKKRSERRKHCARAGCIKVRTPPARPPQTRPQTHRQDRLQYTAPLSLARSVMTATAGHSGFRCWSRSVMTSAQYRTTMSDLLCRIRL